MGKVFCNYCVQEIRDQDELITASNKFRLKPFHYKCFQEQEQETKTQFGLWIPVNGMSGNITTVLMLALALWTLLTDVFHTIGDILGIIALYPVLLRVLSYFIFERKLPKYIENKKPLQ
jgi:hypothetical protein